MSGLKAAWLARVAVVAALAWGLGQGVSAAAEPIPGSIANLQVSGNRVSGVINLRAGQQVVSVDPGVSAKLGTQMLSVATKPAVRKQRTTVLLIDASGSMGQSGMATVRSAVKDFLVTVPKDVKVGVVSFGNTAGPEIAPTIDRAKVQAAVDALKADGETAMFDGVIKAVDMLGTAGDRSIVLLSDGKNTIGDRTKGLNAAVKALTTSQVRVEVVRFTTGENDPAALEAFARAGGGSVAQATDSAAVRNAFLAAAIVLDAQTEFDFVRPAGLTGRLPLVLTGTATGRPFTVSGTVDLGAQNNPVPTASASTAVPPSGGSTSLTRVATGPSTSLIIGLIALFIGLLALIVAVADPFRSRRRDRVAEVAQYTLGGAPREHHAPDATPSAVAESAVRLGERFMEGRASTRRTMELIHRADLPLRAGEWVVLRVLAVIVAGLVIPYLVPLPWWIALPLAVVLGWVLPSKVLHHRAAKRARQFEEMLPDVLMLVATTLASGFSLSQALDAVARDTAEPAGKEFSRALAETRIGTDVSDALEHLAVRMDSESMRWTTMAIRIQRDVGGNLAETLRTTAQTLRDRESLKRQVNTLSAEGRLTAYILMALPIGLFLYMSYVNPDYASLLWTTVPGIVMSVGSGLGMFVGMVWLRKVIRIEV